MDDSNDYWSILRSKNLTPLEIVKRFKELLQCPVCQDFPIMVPLQMCINGHTYCQKCRDAWRSNCELNGLQFACPVCRYPPLNDTRNVVAENICSEIAELEAELESALSESQSDIVTLMESTDMRTMPIRNGLERSCPMVSCLLELPPDLMYEHVRRNHFKNLIQMETRKYPEGFLCSKTLYVEYKLDKFYNYALHAKDLGLFSYRIIIDSDGTLTIILQVIDSTPSTQFFYEFSLRIDEKKDPWRCEGMIQKSSYDRFRFPACKYDKRHFSDLLNENMPSKRSRTSLEVELDIKSQ